MNQEKIGKFIAACRKNKNLTQQQLAEKLGISDRAISKWENGKCLMDISFLKPLSEILDVSVVEILNGEQIVNEIITQQAEELTLNSIDYAMIKIKKEKLKNIIIIMCVFIFILIASFIIYKGILLLKFYSEPIENYQEIKNNLKIKNTINIYKKTIDEKKYLSINNIKIRNDFSDYERKIDKEFTQYINKNKFFTISKPEKQYIDRFTSSNMYIYSVPNINKKNNWFNDADRKYFLLKNDINNDIDFLKYIRENYYINNNIFMKKREIIENYAINNFVSLALPTIESITLINGDYIGYIFNLSSSARDVHIIRNNMLYIFSFYGEGLTTDEYIADLLSTLEIK